MEFWVENERHTIPMCEKFGQTIVEKWYPCADILVRRIWKDGTYVLRLWVDEYAEKYPHNTILGSTVTMVTFPTISSWD